MPSLADFLKRNSIVAGDTLPLVHSVQAYHLRRIREQDAIVATECDVFKGENLNYFFMGRPAYKVDGGDAVAAHWELPCCFIFEYQAIRGIKRIFPFDSGAHHLQRYPKYINMMEMTEFDAAEINEAPARIIGAFFGDAKSYFDLKPKSADAFDQEFGLGPLDAEISAVHRLAGDNRASGGFDDRRFTIELQSDQQVDLKITKPMAVILPVIYLDDDEVRDCIETRWGAEAITYSVVPLSVEKYYATIYEKVLDFYKSRGLL